MPNEKKVSNRSSDASNPRKAGTNQDFGAPSVLLISAGAIIAVGLFVGFVIYGTFG
jgi:hypothetical protein